MSDTTTADQARETPAPVPPPPPPKGRIKIESPSDGAVIGSSTVEVTGKWTGTNLLNPKIEVKIDTSPEQTSGQFAAPADGNWTHTFATVPAGSFQITAELTADNKPEPASDGPVNITRPPATGR
jgi:hypothetical protein